MADSLDWDATDREDVLTFEMLDPNSMESRGMLDGVILTGSSLTYDDRSDTRVSGTLNIIDSNYIAASLVRIWHSVPAWGYRVSLATCFTLSDDADLVGDVWSGSLELHSTLYRLNDAAWSHDFVIQQGEKASNVIDRICKEFGAAYRIEPTCSDYRYATTCVCFVGSSSDSYASDPLSTLFSAAKAMGARLDVDGMGVIVIEPDVLARYRASEHAFRNSGANANIIGTISRSKPVYSKVNRVIVCYKSDSLGEIVGSAELPASHPSSRANLGRYIDSVETVDDLIPANVQGACQQAGRDLDKTVETAYEFSGLYAPIGTYRACTLDTVAGKTLEVREKDVSLDGGMVTKWKVVSSE